MAGPATDIGALRKSGRLDDALDLARRSFNAAPRDAFVQHAYGWVLYDLLKREIKAFEDKRLSAGRLANRLNEWLGEYQRLDRTDRPGMLHSMLLTQAVKCDRAWHGFLTFSRWWDPACLREEDKQPFTNRDGKVLPSLELRLTYAVGRAAVGSGRDLELRDWAEAFLDRSLASNPNDQWLHHYKSKLLIAHGRATEARISLLRVAKRQQGAAWVWSLIGRTFEDDDREKATTCYFRAVEVARQPREVIRTRVRLAKLLTLAARFPEAARQVRTAVDLREKEGWRIPPELAEFLRADWYRELRDRKDLPSEPNVSAAASAILFGAEGGKVETRVGVLDHHNVEKGNAHVAFSPDSGVVLRYRNFSQVAELPVGTFAEVGFVGDPPHPLRVKRSEQETIVGFCEQFQGTLSRRANQAFGFITTAGGDRVFVPPPILDNFAASPGKLVQCLAILGQDRKRGAARWKALIISLSEDN